MTELQKMRMVAAELDSCKLALEFTTAQLDRGLLELAAGELRDIDETFDLVRIAIVEIAAEACRQRFETILGELESAASLLERQLHDAML